MKKNYNLFTFVLLFMTSVLFYYGVAFSTINMVILHTLEFLILFEIVRAIAEFILNKENRIKMRYIIDSAILFSIRELYVGLVELHTNLQMGAALTGISLVALGALIFFRTKLVKYSPDFFKD